MAPQLKLDLDGKDPQTRRPWSIRRILGKQGLAGWGSKAPGAMEIVGGRLLYWAPVWLPLIFVSQIALGGLRPARADARRLDAAEFEVQGLESELAADATRLATHERKLRDPIYRERVRKSLTTAGSKPLLLEDADDS